jgi:hypothetical protein
VACRRYSGSNHLDKRAADENFRGRVAAANKIKTMKIFVTKIGVALAGFLAGISVALADPAMVKIVRAVEPFDLTDVRLLDGPFRDAMLRDQKYLLSLDPDRLSLNFRVNVGLPSSAQPLGGWEDPSCELRGHSLGHYLSALSLMYASTGDARFKRRVDYIVTELGGSIIEPNKAGRRPTIDVPHTQPRPAARCDVDSVLQATPRALRGLLEAAFRNRMESAGGAAGTDAK